MPEFEAYRSQLEALARDQGLDYYPVNFELVPGTFMMEVAVYGLPVRMPHWSFGVRYIHQLVQHRMGNSRLFEVVFPGDPSRAYLAKNNTLQENTLIVAHVLGHADFSKNNELFRRSQEQVGYNIVEQAAEHARQIGDAVELHGDERVEAVLDAALALEAHIDVFAGLHRKPYPTFVAERKGAPEDAFQTRYRELDGQAEAAEGRRDRRRAPRPPRPEKDLLWFIAHHGIELEDWERDIFLTVREESFYFFPVFATQIMNEGWASYWHARLLREADFLPQANYLDAIKTHSDVVRPYAGSDQVALQINPYHLGFCIWEKIVEGRGLDHARRIMQEDDDFSFVRNYLDEELARELNLFRYEMKRNGEIRVIDVDIDALRESILAPKFNFGAPAVAVKNLRVDGTLELEHDHATDGRGLDLERARKVLEYLHRVWRRPIVLDTVDDKGKPLQVTVGT
jgi:stage V sporulation protein R